MTRLQILIAGQVQGVGFRPHVYQVACQLSLTGWVQNHPSGVLIDIQGPSVTEFLPKLTASLPPLARVDDVQTKKIDIAHNERKFKIIQSASGKSRTMISPDISPCDDCLHELFNPESHYYHYPFLNCTQCGPRLTVTRALPYDRKQTSMDTFPLCTKCHKDYQDPHSRRYHAQPTACAQCGPQLSHSINTISDALLRGKIVALKGVGGYQLLCDATNETSIQTLRQRKHRDAKPFALMVSDIKHVHAIAEVNHHETQLLEDPARPIVLLKQQGSILPESIAPGLSHLGIMLPSSPLHYLLFNAVEQEQSAIFIVTSANINGEPLIIEDKEAYEKLVSIADLIVSYNRPIVTRADDSIVRIVNHTPLFIRRARGFVPERIKLPCAMPTTLALGGHLKNTFCITRDDEAFVSQHIGSLNNQATLAFFHESLTHWMQFLDVKPERIACDLHPDFYTTQLAHDYQLETITVQHHHAHLASVAAEHHIVTPALGLALDGYGYGLDGSAWGGELLLFDHTHAKRLGNLRPLPAPGGDIAAREPWRMAASVLQALGLNHRIIQQFSEQPQASLLAKLLNTNTPIPTTSSCGRLFDAASALLGVNHLSSYEGQAAQQLESLVTQLEILPRGWHIEAGELDLLPMLRALLVRNPVNGANIFHGTLIAGLTEWLTNAATEQGINIIVLSGGCFLNKILTEGLTTALTGRGFHVHLPRCLPPNDGGLSLGQAWVAGTKGLEHVFSRTCKNH